MSYYASVLNGRCNPVPTIVSVLTQTVLPFTVEVLDTRQHPEPPPPWVFEMGRLVDCPVSYQTLDPDKPNTYYRTQQLGLGRLDRPAAGVLVLDDDIVMAPHCAYSCWEQCTAPGAVAPVVLEAGGREPNPWSMLPPDRGVVVETAIICQAMFIQVDKLPVDFDLAADYPWIEPHMRGTDAVLSVYLRERGYTLLRNGYTVAFHLGGTERGPWEKYLESDVLLRQQVPESQRRLVDDLFQNEYATIS